MEITVTHISRITAGFYPKFRVEFSDGFKMRSDEQSEFIESKYYELMDSAIYSYVYGTPIGPTSHEDLYNY